MLRLGIVGAGIWGAMHARAYAQNALVELAGHQLRCRRQRRLRHRSVGQYPAFHRRQTGRHATQADGRPAASRQGSRRGRQQGHEPANRNGAFHKKHHRVDGLSLPVCGTITAVRIGSSSLSTRSDAAFRNRRTSYSGTTMPTCIGLRRRTPSIRTCSCGESFSRRIGMDGGLR